MAVHKAVFSPEIFKFFRDLGRNNSKAWMDAHRERYQTHVVGSFRALLAELSPAMRTLHPYFDTSGRTGSNFSRINRDIRFAKDKTPYRPQMYLTFSSTEVKEGDAQLYVGISAENVTVGFRVYGDTRHSRLATVTAPHLRENVNWVSQQKKRLGRKYESYWYTSEKGEWTKHETWPVQLEDWKKMQGWIVRKKLKPAAAVSPKFASEIIRSFRELFPLYRFTSIAPGEK